MSGGFLDFKRLRLNLHSELMRCDAEFVTAQAAKTATEQKIADLDDEVTRHQSAALRADKQHKALERQLADLVDEISVLTRQVRVASDLFKKPNYNFFGMLGSCQYYARL